MAYIFLDESGQFTRHDSDKYFVVGSFTVGDHRRTEKRFRSWCRTRFPKKMRYQDEIKFSQNNISDRLRLRTIKYISDLDVRIRYSFLERKNIPSGFWKHKKLESGLLYAEVVSSVVEAYISDSDDEIRVFCDQRKLMGITKAKFQEMLTARMLSNLPAKSIFTVDMLDSLQEPNIQIADWITGSIARYYENKPLGKGLFAILRNNIIGDGIELFRDHWLKKIKNKKLNRND